MKRLFFIILYSLCFMSLSRVFAENIVVDISSIPEEYSGLFYRILTDNPLPGGTALSKAPGGKAVCSISMRALDFQKEPDALSGDWVIVSEEWFAPAVSLYETRDSISLKSALEERENILPLYTLNPPIKALVLYLF